MATDIVIPALGESINSGVITTWRKAEGERVERDETLLELETDKITLELPSPASGVLKRNAAEGDTVEVGSVVGSIDESGAAAPSAPAPAKAEQPAKQPEPAKPAAPAPSPAPEIKPAQAATPAAPALAASSSSEVRATPLARKMAEEQGVDVARISGTGPGGRVREQDVLAFVQSRAPDAAPAPSKPAAPSPAQPTRPPEARTSAAPAAPASARSVTRERLTPLRHRIAQRLVEAQHTAAMLTTFNECDMTAVMALRSKHKEEFEKRHGVGLGFMSFFVSACASALRAFPLVNASLVENDKGEIEIEKRSYFDIAIAVGTPKGLTVPVLRDCQSRSFAQVEDGIRDLASRARDGKLSLDELQGGTFTITNGGVYGSLLSTPILNPPQSGILGMHNIVRRPIEHPDKPGSGEVVVRPMMYLALSYDHRIVDGAEAVSFLVHIKKCIEDPARMLLGV